MDGLAFGVFAAVVSAVLLKIDIMLLNSIRPIERMAEFFSPSREIMFSGST